MKLTTYAWIMAIVVFVGTLPHAVGAMFHREQPLVKEIKQRCEHTGKGNVSLSDMKRLAKRIGEQKTMAIYKSKHEWNALFTLWNKESRWDYTADNPSSSAYGIPQMLNMDEKTPMVRQIELGLKYIQHRYETPSKALAFHNRNGWY
jgi:hypothetical protein